MAYYGYASYGAGHEYGYYSTPSAGGYLNATNGLTGPGSHAYYANVYGSSYESSYAYEGQNGSILEINTTDTSSGTFTQTSYNYRTSGYGYSHITSYDSVPHAGSGYYGDYYKPTQQSYSSEGVTSSSAGDHAYVDIRYFSETLFQDGTSVADYQNLTQSFYDNHFVVGSDYTYKLSSYTDASGYTAYASSHSSF